MSISKLASIHPDARIGKNDVIEPFTSIAADVTEIGDGTWIGPNASIMDGARIGANCRIFPGAVISAIPQDLKFAGERTTAEVGRRHHRARVRHHQPRHLRPAAHRRREEQPADGLRAFGARLLGGRQRGDRQQREPCWARHHRRLGYSGRQRGRAAIHQHRRAQLHRRGIAWCARTFRRM
jgi:hypothetical protein